MQEPGLRHLFDLSIMLHPIHILGQTPAGERRVVPVSGGSFSGERLRGEVLAHGGSDVLLRRGDGSYQQDVRLVLSTDDGALILMTYRGVRFSSPEVAARIAAGTPVSASEYYLRTAPFFETAEQKYSWMNNIVSIGAGERTSAGVTYRVFEIL